MLRRSSPWRAEDQPDWSKLYTQNSTVVEKKDVTIQYMFTWRCILNGCGFALWIILIWAVPTFVGICTQIRRGLPAFARAPRTITAAANYESHRLIYLSLLMLIFLAVEAALRWYTIIADGMTLNPLAKIGMPSAWMVILATTMGMQGLISLFGACGWIGPFRSDYTRQLIRSRFHVFRMIVMYALLLPVFITMAIGTIVDWFVLDSTF